MTNKPNIIILNPDEMRWDTMGHMGNPAASTPRLDDFVQTDAVSFENAYCQNPVCVPSRCSFLTGLYPHVHGHRTMHHLMHDGSYTLFAELKRNGYKVWMNSRNDFIAGNIPGEMATQFDEIELNQSSMPNVAEEYPYSHYVGVVNKISTDIEDTLAACERIKQQKDAKDPLCLFLGWMNPHVPYVTDQEHYDRIDPEKILERVKYQDCTGKSQMIEKLRDFANVEAIPEKIWNEIQRVYLAQCSYIDDLFGMVIDALQEAGIYDDSLIVFLSDHGDFAGDFDLPEKAQNSFEDILTRVPLLIKPPKKEAVDPGKTRSLVELIDFYATAMHYADVEPEHDQFGQSLHEVIADREKEIRKYAFSEGGRRPCEKQADEFHRYGNDGPAKTHDYWAKMNAEADDNAHAKGTMITNGKYKYVLRMIGEDEFYDLEIDPRETTNRINEVQYMEKILEMKLAMLDWYQETCDVVPRGYDSRSLSKESLARKSK